VTQIRLQPKTISNVVNYIVVVDAENDDGSLLPGMTATADLVVGRAENVLLVPNSALRFTPEQGDDSDKLVRAHRVSTPTTPQHLSLSSSVYILKDNGSLSRVAVQTGLNNDLLTEVKDNLLIRDGTMIISGENRGQEQKKTSVSFFPPPPGN
jgi:HlyD family secretion protein